MGKHRTQVAVANPVFVVAAAFLIGTLAFALIGIVQAL